MKTSRFCAGVVAGWFACLLTINLAPLEHGRAAIQVTNSTDTVRGSTGSITLGGRDNVNNESLTFDFETTANKVILSSATGVTETEINTDLDLDGNLDAQMTNTTDHGAYLRSSTMTTGNAMYLQGQSSDVSSGKVLFATENVTNPTSNRTDAATIFQSVISQASGGGVRTHNYDSTRYVRQITSTDASAHVTSTGAVLCVTHGITPTAGTIVDDVSLLEMFHDGDSTGDAINITMNGASGNLITTDSGFTVSGSAAVTAATVDTGQGANELYAMNQDVETTDSVTFAGINNSDTNITNVGDIALDTISSDAGTTVTVGMGTDAGDDFKVNSSSHANAFVVEGDSGQVGFGTSDPVGVVTAYRDDAITTGTFYMQQDGTGDATMSFELVGVIGYAFGIDNSDNDRWKVSRASQVGTNDCISIDTNRTVHIEYHLVLPTYSDATRGAAGTAGRIIFNTDDGAINVDDGSNWTLADGTTT